MCYSQMVIDDDDDDDDDDYGDYHIVKITIAIFVYIFYSF